MTIKTCVQLTLMVVLLPLLAHVLQKAKVSPFNRDVWVARMSLVLAAAGYAMVGLANSLPLLVTGLVVYGLSNGAEATIRSLIASSATNVGTGVLFSLMSIIQGTGILISGPIMAASFRAGLRLGKVWLGLPLLIASGLMAITALVFFIVPLRKRAEEQASETGETEEGS